MCLLLGPETGQEALGLFGYYSGLNNYLYNGPQNPILITKAPIVVWCYVRCWPE